MKLAIDTHVHVYDGYPLDDFFYTLAENIRLLEQECGERMLPVLMLTESLNCSWFDHTFGRIEDLNGHPLGLVEKIDETSVKLTINDKEIVIVKGYQIVSTDDIEILALGMSKRINDGLPSQDVIDQIYQYGGLAVLPWGVGKWVGRRGSVVSKLLTDNANLYCGDNSGRPGFLGEPRQFKFARQAGRRILCGSDPLPLANGFSKVGTCVEIMDVEEGVDISTPTILKMIINPLNHRSRMSLTDGVSFFTDQVKMQVRKWMRNKK